MLHQWRQWLTLQIALYHKKPIVAPIKAEANTTNSSAPGINIIFKKDANKISICCELQHESGSLYRMLSHFIYNNLNMTKIESRPIYGRNWEYRFFLDFEGNLADSAVRNALRGLREETRNMKILGNY